MNGDNGEFHPLACVASFSVLFRSKERARNEILGFGRARNETRAYSRHFSRGLYCAVFDSRNSTETLATQAIHPQICKIKLTNKGFNA